MVDSRFYELVRHLWRGGSFGYWWTPDSDEGKLSFWFSANKPTPISHLWKSINVYFGVHPSSVEGQRRTRAKIEDIEVVNCLFAEFDLATGQTPEHLLAAIMSLDTPPSTLHFSGGGYHGYWLLAQTYHIDSPEARQRIIDIQYAWADYVGSDGAAKDLARVLRVPGTFNRKPEYGPNFPQVEIVHFDLDATYELDELVKQVEHIIEQNKSKHIAAANVDVVPVDYDDQTILEKMWQKDADTVALWAGDMSAYSDDHSSADLALCSKLAFWFGRDPQRIDRVFRRSALYRTKWLRDDYRNRTIDRAIASCTNTYTPPGDKNLGNVNGLVNGAVNTNGATVPPPPTQQPQGSTAPPPSSQNNTTPPLAANYLLNEGVHDEGNARCVHMRYQGRFLHNDSFDWIQFTGTHWTIDEANSGVERAITETLIARMQEAIRIDPNKYADLIRKTVPNSGKVQGAKAQLDSLVSASEKQFDIEPDSLNCLNGLVDLRNGSITTHSPSQRFMHCTAVPYNPNADQSYWVNWLTDAVGSVEVAFWLKLAVGYSLTGHTREEVLFYLFGPPRSGKGTFTETLLALLGSPLAKEVNFATFTAQRTGDSQNFDLAPLKPCRFLAASESNTYERFNEAKVKALTGGNEIYCAYKHRTHFSYRPQFKIWLSSNQPVNADPDDDAVWGRIRVIEFPRSHQGQEDKELKVRMRSPAVLEGVLAWAIEGAMVWYHLGKIGLPELAVSAKTKQSQRVDLDNVQAWIEERCELGNQHFATNSELYPSYFDWCKLNGVTAKQQKAFSQSLKRKGLSDKVIKRNGKAVRGYGGIKVN